MTTPSSRTRAVTFAALSCVAGAGACSIDVQGTGAVGDVQAPTPSTPPADSGGATLAPDASAPAVGPAPAAPDPSLVTLTYAGGKDKVVYRFDVDARTFTALPSAGCPAFEETAVTSDGNVYLTSNDGKHFFRLTAQGCQAIKRDASFPYALGTAAKGTVSQTEEALVGYRGASYVRVSPQSGDVVEITSNALGSLRPSGDLTAVGTRGFLAAARNTGSGPTACPDGGDCVVEVDIKTGKPVALLSHHPGMGIFGIAHGRGGLLLYANGQVFSYDIATKTLGPSLAQMPTGASFTGAGAPPYPAL